MFVAHVGQNASYCVPYLWSIGFMYFCQNGVPLCILRFLVQACRSKIPVLLPSTYPNGQNPTLTMGNASSLQGASGSVFFRDSAQPDKISTLLEKNQNPFGEEG